VQDGLQQYQTNRHTNCFYSKGCLPASAQVSELKQERDALRRTVNELTYKLEQKTGKKQEPLQYEQLQLTLQRERQEKQMLRRVLESQEAFKELQDAVSALSAMLLSKRSPSKQQQSLL
jgi:predicted RNase H-like nuclease (RuvC/YqgF family)